jgi:hypothetical protein
MGNRVSVDEEKWENWEEFLAKVKPYYHAENKKELLPTGYQQLTPEEEVEVALISISGKTYSLPLLKNNSLDVNGWKIMWYWYEDVIEMFYFFQSLGLRGTIRLSDDIKS